ncbi:porin [Geothrix sp. 21YS21S-4]|uniref:porin n=1 Tax=Geothrix sp. 21YS21S-4 TaxID=3068889 RepID=UPI0027B9E950|nr:porin [Geothrix sp. 21YS21S-4]
MKIFRLAGIAALLAAGAAAQAQTPTIKMDGVLLEFWATQMMDNNLRLNTTASAGASKYYALDSRFQENNFAVKRAEIYMSGTITDTFSWNVMFDPNNNNAAAPGAPNNVLQDLVVTWAPGNGFNVKAGQFKMPTGYEATLVAAREILFWDRNQINRRFADSRDRGVWASYTYGDAKAFQGKINVAVSNGTTDDGSGGKNNENTVAGAGNAQKDWTFRFDSNFLSRHKAGVYYREGVTNLKDSTFVSATVPASWAVGAPNASQIRDNKDKTTMMGAYYAFNSAAWQMSAEYATGLLGRRYPTVFTAAAAPLREHLDQKFAGYAVDGAYKMGNHWITGRYDVLNYNSGDDWYTVANPYKTATGDFSPKYTEVTVGYNYVFIPTKQSAGKVKLDYIIRSKNFLAPRAGQTGEQGGNTLVASLMFSY